MSLSLSRRSPFCKKAVNLAYLRQRDNHQSFWCSFFQKAASFLKLMRQQHAAVDVPQHVAGNAAEDAFAQAAAVAIGAGDGEVWFQLGPEGAQQARMGGA